jgi:hypothetical protein
MRDITPDLESLVARCNSMQGAIPRSVLRTQAMFSSG